MSKRGKVHVLLPIDGCAESTVEIGYGIIPSAQGKGYATEAVQRLVEWALSNRNVTMIVAECLDDNVPSIRVLEKLQMKRIGSENNMLYWHLKNNFHYSLLYKRHLPHDREGALYND